jgi:hypothetical protein
MARFAHFIATAGSIRMGKISATKAEDDWQVENDLRILQECEVIEKDPKRLAAAQALARKKLLELAAVASEGPND